MKLNIDAIFVTHYSKLTERKRYLTEVMPKFFSNEVEWCQNFDRETITKDQLKLYNHDKNLWDTRLCKEIYGKQGGFRKLKISEIANFLCHLDVYKRIVDRKIQKAIIFEDDIIFNKEILKFNEMLEKTPNDFDMIYFGQNYNWDNFQNKTFKGMRQPQGYNVIKAYPPNSRTADAYVITYASAKKYIDNLKEFVLPVDFEMNYWNWKLNLNVYHWWPGICYQGTFTKKYKSSAN